jgi:hypothetical protein
MEVVVNRLARASFLAVFTAVALVSSACDSPAPPPEHTSDPAPAVAAAAPAATSDAAAAAMPTSGSEDSAPAAERAKYYRPVKGEATIELIRGTPKRVGQDMVTVVQIKNTSQGRIDLLVVDEYWYDTNRQNVSGTSERYRKPFNPGEIIEITLKSPVKPNLYQNMLMFSHANGKISPKEVKKFEDEKM